MTQLIQIKTDPLAYQRWLGLRRKIDEDDGWHCLLREVLGDNAVRPYRAMGDLVYGYSQQEPDGLRHMIEACEDRARREVFKSVQGREMPTDFSEGRVLNFNVLVIPTMRPNSGPYQGKDIDAYQVMRWRRGYEGSPEQAYIEWLAGRLERQGGARLIEGSCRNMDRRTRQRRTGRRFRRQSVELEGKVEVASPELFGALLTKGLGKSGFGHGMVLIR